MHELKLLQVCVVLQAQLFQLDGVWGLKTLPVLLHGGQQAVPLRRFLTDVKSVSGESLARKRGSYQAEDGSSLLESISHWQFKLNTWSSVACPNAALSPRPGISLGCCSVLSCARLSAAQASSRDPAALRHAFPEGCRSAAHGQEAESAWQEKAVSESLNEPTSKSAHVEKWCQV